jgi:hypothetical protein
MNYTISRAGQTLGIHSLDQARDLLQAGRLLPNDLASPEAGGSAISVAQLVAPSTPPPTLPPPPDAFLVRRGSEQFGPYPFGDLQRYTLEGRFRPADMTWCPGMPAWEPLTQVLQRRGVTLPGPPRSDSNESLKWVLPVGRSGLAIAAGYLGLFSILILPAPISLVVGILAVRDLKKNPTLGGAGRAWFGIIAGGLGTLFLLAMLVVPIFTR